MNDLLLDTHALLWFDTAPERIPETVLAQIRQRKRNVYVSAISAWELAIKHRLGKLPEAESLLSDYHQTIARYGFAELPFSSYHALLAGRLETHHKDPFDRALLAQATAEMSSLVSKDPALHGVAGVETLW